MKAKCWLALSMFAVSSAALAQTACPTGAAAGSAQCGPSPDSHGVNPSSSAEPEVRYVPIGRWKTTWGAIADDETGTGNIGVAVGKFSKREAAFEAISKCESLGGGKCKLTFAFDNQCAVIASPSVDGKEVGGTPVSRGGETIEEASELASRACTAKNNSSECMIIYSDCSKPIFEEF